MNGSTTPQPTAHEIRVALAMNGGVSLAVWIGGVSAEFYRASRRSGLYGDLAALTDSDVRIDVLAGSSAGGLNGAFLAVAIAYELDDTVFDQLRGVWLDAGSFTNLLRDPRQKDAPSLLLGDDYFLRRIEEVILNWIANRTAPSPPDEDDLDLVLTTTTLEPSGAPRADDAGNVLVDPVHRARLLFAGARLRSTAPEVLSRQLARAARSSASFPAAFEPSFIRVGGEAPAGGPDEVDMRGIASFDSSKWTVDGGVLVNKPVGPALDLVRRHRSSRDGRRVVVYVNPDPGTVTRPQPADRAMMPTIAEVVRKAVVDLPRAESISADLADIRDQQRRQTIQSKFRESLLLGVSLGDRDEIVDLPGTGATVYPLWLRRTGIAEAERAVAVHLRDTMEMPTSVVPGTTFRWSAVAEALRRARGQVRPYAAALPPTAAPLTEWRYPLAGVRYLCETALDLTRRAMGIVPRGADDLRQRLESMRQPLVAVRRAVDRAAVELAAYWSQQLAAGPARDETVDVWAARLLAASPTVSTAQRTELTALARQCAAAIVDGHAHLLAACALGEATNLPGASVLRRLVAAILSGRPDNPPPYAADVEVVLRRLLALYVLHDAIEPYDAEDEPLEFIQLAAHIASPLDPGRRAEDKVTGLQLGHFGGFLKTSWRANDWMWGCLDGAAQLARLYLHPRRLRQAHPSSDAFLARLAPIVGRGTDPAALAALRAELGTATLDFLDGEGRRTPSADVDIGPLVELVVAALQGPIAARELPAVAAAIRRSAKESANESPAADDFASQVERADPLTPAVAGTLVPACPVGRERVDSERGTDAMTELAVRAAAVTTATLAGSGSGLPPLRLLFNSLRTAMLTAYVVTHNAVRRNKLAVFLTLLLLAVGGGVVAAKLLGASVGTGALVVAIYLLLAGVTVACLTVGMRWALPPIGVAAALIALASIDENDAVTLFGDPNEPGWKPVVHWGGAILAVLIGSVSAWFFVRRGRSRRGAVQETEPLTRQRRTAEIAGATRRAVTWSIAGGLLGAAAWWLVMWVVRWHMTSPVWVDVFRNTYEWRALIIVFALTVAPMTIGATIDVSRRSRHRRP